MEQDVHNLRYTIYAVWLQVKRPELKVIGVSNLSFRA